MFKHILVPIDESQFSMEIIEQGIRMAGIHSAKVSFLYLSPDEGSLVSGDAGLLHAMAPDLFARKYLWQDGYIKARALGWSRTAKLDAQFISDVVVGSVHHAILEQAQKIGADLVLMGAHWRASLLARLFGSVTTKVVLNANMPVLVSPAGPDELSPRSRVIAQFREVHALWIAMFELLLDELEKTAPTSALVSRTLGLMECIAMEVADVLAQPEFELLLNISAETQASIGDFFSEMIGRQQQIAVAWEQSGIADPAAVGELRAEVVEHVIDENNLLLSRAEEQLDDTVWAAAAETLERDPWSSRRAARQNAIRELFGQTKKHLVNSNN